MLDEPFFEPIEEKTEAYKKITTNSYSLEDPEYKYDYSLKYVLLLTLNASLVQFFIGWSFGVFDTIQVNIKQIYAWTEEDERFYLSFISSAIPIGGFLGCLVSGQIVANFGRRISFILFDVFAIFGIGLTLFVNEYMMIVGRFICGICVGGFSTVVSLYVSEYSPYAISGACGAIYEFFFCLGIFSSFLFGLGLPEIQDYQNQWWRLMIVFPGFWLLVNMLVLIFLFKFDTPKFTFLHSRDYDLTTKCLQQIYLKKEDCDKMIQNYEEEIKTQREKVSFKNLFGEKYKLRLFLSIIIMISQQTSGIDSLLMYSDEIFLKNFSTDTAIIYTNLIGLAQVISGFTTIFIIEKLGRRKLLLVGLFFISISLLAISYCYYFDFYSPVIFLFIFFTFCNGISPSPVCYVYASDILPEVGVSFSISFNYLASFVVAESFLFLQSSLGLPGSILIYAMCSLSALIVCYLWMEETKGLSSVEIDEKFEKNKPSIVIKQTINEFSIN